ncbi:hypothetical protein IWZ03DRAFT_206942 [Phyllosticta citriasiana]|uniref:Uncharacterized protein n=1 Tax=Phyllosticta citriasiana TaxID=595635 RepID=A0ABR1KL16_9PEZI
MRRGQGLKYCLSIGVFKSAFFLCGLHFRLPVQVSDPRSVRSLDAAMMVDDYSLGVAVLPRGRYQWQLTDAGENYSKQQSSASSTSLLLSTIQQHRQQTDYPPPPPPPPPSSSWSDITLLPMPIMPRLSFFLISGLLAPRTCHRRLQRRSIAYKSRRRRRHGFHCFQSVSLLWTQREGRKFP